MRRKKRYVRPTNTPTPPVVAANNNASEAGFTIEQINKLAADVTRTSKSRNRTHTHILVKGGERNKNRKNAQLCLYITEPDIGYFTLDERYAVKYLSQYRRIYFIPDKDGNKCSRVTRAKSLQISFSDFTNGNLIAAEINKLDGYVETPVYIDPASKCPYVEIPEKNAKEVS